MRRFSVTIGPMTYRVEVPSRPNARDLAREAALLYFRETHDGGEPSDEPVVSEDRPYLRVDGVGFVTVATIARGGGWFWPRVGRIAT